MDRVKNWLVLGANTGTKSKEGLTPMEYGTTETLLYCEFV